MFSSGRASTSTRSSNHPRSHPDYLTISIPLHTLVRPTCSPFLPLSFPRSPLLPALALPASHTFDLNFACAGVISSSLRYPRPVRDRAAHYGRAYARRKGPPSSAIIHRRCPPSPPPPLCPPPPRCSQTGHSGGPPHGRRAARDSGRRPARRIRALGTWGSVPCESRSAGSRARGGVAVAGGILDR